MIKMRCVENAIKRDIEPWNVMALHIPELALNMIDELYMRLLIIDGLSTSLKSRIGCYTEISYPESRIPWSF